MKLPHPTPELTRDLAEFDIWITPSLGEISDTDRFKEELNRIVWLFELLGSATDNFTDESHCEPAAIAETFARIAEGKSEDERSELFQCLAATLFLVTGKSDNNAKCQFPLYLRDVAQWNQLPAVSRRGGRNRVQQKALPRTLKSDDFMKLVAAIEDSAMESRLLAQYVSFLLMGEDAVRQFWSLGYSFFALKQFGRGYERNLLAPIVIFKVRGSVSASGGHRPEALLRAEMESWGLIGGLDFNLADVIVDAEDGDSDTKTRAYDFVLPYRVPHWPEPWENRLMMQSQFYAGDSGSVSHKNVDQTSTSRERVLRKFPNTRFVEYVDGAGYFSSLNGDLRKLLAMDTTHSFIQIRSAPIRLRREFQKIGFLTPLEVEHAIVRTNGEKEEVAKVLTEDGYEQGEVARALAHVEEHNLVLAAGSALDVLPTRRALVRQMWILDLVAIHGQVVKVGTQASAGSILVPGYGPFYGMDLDSLVKAAVQQGGSLRNELSNSLTFSEDVKALSTRGFVMMR